MALDLTSLRNAVRRLSEGLATAKTAPANELLRDGAIQRFEYTYELSHRMLRRYLTATEPSPDVAERLSFPDLVRLASQRGLLKGDWETWHRYRTARGTTSHTYDSAKAAEVFAIVPAFLAEVEFLLAAMSRVSPP